MSTKSSTSMILTNQTRARITFELRDNKGKFLRYIKLGSPDDQELAEKRKSIPHKVVVGGEELKALMASPIVQGRLERGDLSVAPAS